MRLPAPAIASQTKHDQLSRWWALVPFISAGLFAWAPFLYASLRTGYARFRNWTIAYAAWAIGGYVLTSSGAAGGAGLTSLASLPLLLLPFAAAIHTLAI